jgi:hypothetical protein
MVRGLAEPPTVHSGQTAVNESVNELQWSRGTDANDDNDRARKSGQQTTESC